MSFFSLFWFAVLITGRLFVTATVHANVSQTPGESYNQTKCIPAGSTVLHSTIASRYVVPYTTKFPNGYCRDIIGNSMVYGNPWKLLASEMKLQWFKHISQSFLKMTGPKRINTRLTSANVADVSRTCLEFVDVIYCHWYFPQYRISSTHQSVCREDCERLYFHICKKEFELLDQFTAASTGSSSLWDIMDCTQLPWRNATDSECYYHDNVRDQLDKLIDSDCYYGIGKGYSGNISVTRSGYTCQSWSSKCPHKHSIDHLYRELKTESNFCRNPGGVGIEGPWCFTTNPNVTWEYCAVPKCPQRGPSLAPPHVKARSINSTSIQVTWDKIPIPNHQGILREYHVECAKSNSSEWANNKVQVKFQNLTLYELEKYTNYSCRVRGKNNFGNGNWSNLVNVSTNEDAPNAPPQGVKAWNTSSTSLHVMWKPVPLLYQHGRIVGYIVRWRSDGDGKEQNQTTLARSLPLTGLRKFTKYSIDVSAVTRVGAGPASAPVTVKTDEDEPSAPPQGVKAWNTSSTSILVTWEPVPLPNQHGRIVGYIVRWRSDHGKEQNQTTLARSLSLTGLGKFTEYSVNVSALTRMGAGPASAPVTVKTDEDVPGRPVENLTVTEIGPHSIRAIWEKVPPGYENGNIRGYKILLINQDNTIKYTTINEQKIDIEDLEQGTRYLIKVRPYTAKGDGRPSTKQFIIGGQRLQEPSGNREGKQRIETGKGRNKYSTDLYTIIGLTAGFSAVVIVLVIAILAYYHQRRHPNIQNVRHMVAPYAEVRIEHIEYPFYDEINENGARYRNLNMDGTHNIPARLRDVFIDFEQLYENLRYKRFEGVKLRRRSFSGAIDEHGHPIYDVLTHLVVMSAAPPGTMTRELANKKQGRGNEFVRRRQSVDLGHVEAVVKAMNEFGSN